MPQRNAIVFGVNGQDGYYLTQLLADQGFTPIGVSRSNGPWTIGDVADRSFVEGLIQAAKPEKIFHLAAISSTQHSAWLANHRAIETGTWNILEAAYRHLPTAKVFITGSGLQFRNNNSPISENNPFEASSAYAASRIQSVYAARYYRSLGLKTYVGYFFHHDSPLRSNRHIAMQIVEGLKRVKNGMTDRICLGNPDVHREWLFAADVVKGALTLVDQETISEAVIGSGVARPLRHWVGECAKILELSESDFEVVTDSDYPCQYRVLVSDPSTIQSIGWRPQTTFQDLARMMVHAAH